MYRELKEKYKNIIMTYKHCNGMCSECGLNYPGLPRCGYQYDEAKAKLEEEAKANESNN